MSNTDTTDIPVKLIRETEKAFLVLHLERDEEGWFPQSQVSFARLNQKTHEGSMTTPDWLLEKKGWI